MQENKYEINDKLSISFVIPVYNEEIIIRNVLEDLKQYLRSLDINYEVIVVNDGSSDDSKEILESIDNIRVVNHPYNKGYGAALKTGAMLARFKWVMFYDGDGQHKPKLIGDLIKHNSQYDMIVGARVGYKGPWIRQPGKKILGVLANYLVDFKIPDLNSGLRMVKKDFFVKYIHLYPDSFSLSTTITMAFLKAGLNVKYVPIEINKRVGKSSVSPRDALKTFILLMRMIALFAPMRIIFPISLIFFVMTLVSVSYDLWLKNISDISVILFVTTILFFIFGVILDQISAVRRELNK
ncbi:MAG: glycosyltransferase [Candidatus Magasanikbacteria bacterium]|nr:glycosyltransferase [Candidatus Magasanikbacteria bacterium]